MNSSLVVAQPILRLPRPQNYTLSLHAQASRSVKPQTNPSKILGFR